MKTDIKAKPIASTGIDKNLSKEELEKLAGYFLAVFWIVALVAGLGFKSWALFFIVLVLTVSYLCKINGIKTAINNGSSSKDWNNNYLNPCNPTGSSMRETRSNNYHY